MRAALRPIPRLLLPLLLVCGSACDEEKLTQIVVVVDGDWDGFTRLRVDVGGFEDDARVDADLQERPLPRRFAIVHDGGPLGPIDVTVRAYAEGFDDPVLIEPRTGIEFVRDETRMLKVDLRFECIGACVGGEACLEGGRCVDGDEAAELVPWTGEVDALDVRFRVDDGHVIVVEGDGGVVTPIQPDGGDVRPPGDGGSMLDSGGPPSGDGGMDGGDDAMVRPVRDAMPMQAPFEYAPGNFDPEASALQALSRVDVEIGCTTAAFDSSDLSFSGWCGPEPQAIVWEQGDGSEAALLVMDTLLVQWGASLRLTGTRPVILAVYGDAFVDGLIDASAAGATPGPGADVDCATAPAAGSAGSGSDGAGGGGGGGFGSPGAAGGGSGSDGAAVAGGSGGGTVGDSSLIPLRGGCSGASGGLGDGDAAAPGGGGGGAVQLSAAGRLEVDGRIAAVGGGGGVGNGDQDGGGGGGSGGAILLEGSPVDLDSAAVVSVGGGSGGAGNSRNDVDATAGSAGSKTSAAAAGGAPETRTGGAGGRGAAAGSQALAGADASEGGSVFSGGSSWGGGGGGGGGVGRIRARGTEGCAPRAVWNPLPSVACLDCGECADPPVLACEALPRAGAVYYLCGPASWDAAKAACENVGMGLAQIDDAGEGAFIQGAAGADVWLGGSDVASEGQWLWSDDTGFWSGGSDGTGTGYTNWAEGEPDGDTDENCLVGLSAGGWNDAECGQMLDYVCEL
ncbi:MAG: C-type lectin domain-containing protein [Myxococcales bacterium]|jgi:hypothetical protein